MLFDSVQQADSTQSRADTLMCSLQPFQIIAQGLTNHGDAACGMQHAASRGSRLTARVILIHQHRHESMNHESTCAMALKDHATMEIRLSCEAVTQ